MNRSKNIVIIPARGGSKRLPNKNVLSLSGKPLIEYSIDFALANNNIVYEIYVSTDDETIKDIALKKDVKVIDRPEYLAGDTISTVAVMKHVIESIQAHKNDTIILLQPTNPLRPYNLLKETYAIYQKGSNDSLMTISRNHQKFGKLVENKFIPFNYELGQRSQDLEPLFFENGLLYITKASLIFEEKILGKNNIPFLVSHPYAQIDIDTETDLKYAEFIINNYSNE